MNTTLPRVPEEPELVAFSENGRRFQLHPDAWKAWKKMKTEAAGFGVELYIVSAFRSIRRQAEIIETKKKEGLTDKEIFKTIAPPGFSEHHSGRAIDIGTPGFPPLEEVFDDSEAYRWLAARAVDFGFRLSYPKDNMYGIAYEPWHWFYEGATQLSGPGRTGKPSS